MQKTCIACTRAKEAPGRVCCRRRRRCRVRRKLPVRGARCAAGTRLPPPSALLDVEDELQSESLRHRRPRSAPPPLVLSGHAASLTPY